MLLKFNEFKANKMISNLVENPTGLIELQNSELLDFILTIISNKEGINFLGKNNKKSSEREKFLVNCGQRSLQFLISHINWLKEKYTIIKMLAMLISSNGKLLNIETERIIFNAIYLSSQRSYLELVYIPRLIQFSRSLRVLCKNILSLQAPIPINSRKLSNQQQITIVHQEISKAYINLIDINKSLASTLIGKDKLDFVIENTLKENLIIFQDSRIIEAHNIVSSIIDEIEDLQEYLINSISDLSGLNNLSNHLYQHKPNFKPKQDNDSSCYQLKLSV